MSQEERLLQHFEPIGTGFCDILQAAISYTGYMSVWLMTAIATDRYYRITKPVRYKKWMTSAKASAIIVSMFLACAWMCYGYYVAHKNSGAAYEPSQCVFYITTSLVVFTIGMTTAYIPLTAMVVYYVKLIRLSRRSRDAIRGKRLQKKDTICCIIRNRGSSGGESSQVPLEMQVVDSGVVEGSATRASSSSGVAAVRTAVITSMASEDTAEQRGHRTLRRSKKAARLIGLIFSAFVICVMPSTVVYCMYTFTPNLRIQETDFIYLYPWLTFLNSALNPVIYFFITQDLRDRATRIMHQYFSLHE